MSSSAWAGHDFCAPTVFDRYETNLQCKNGKEVNLSLWDTSGEEQYDRLRPLSYVEADVVVICFSVAEDGGKSYDSVLTKWYPEVRYYCAGVPIVLLGTMSDLRRKKAPGSPNKLENCSSSKSGFANNGFAQRGPAQRLSMLPTELATVADNLSASLPGRIYSAAGSTAFAGAPIAVAVSSSSTAASLTMPSSPKSAHLNPLSQGNCERTPSGSRVKTLAMKFGVASSNHSLDSPAHPEQQTLQKSKSSSTSSYGSDDTIATEEIAEFKSLSQGRSKSAVACRHLENSDASQIPSSVSCSNWTGSGEITSVSASANREENKKENGLVDPHDQNEPLAAESAKLFSVRCDQSSNSINYNQLESPASASDSARQISPLRPENINPFTKNSLSIEISAEKCQKLASEINAKLYIETSAKEADRKHLEETFQAIAKIAMSYKRPRKFRIQECNIQSYHQHDRNDLSGSNGAVFTNGSQSSSETQSKKKRKKKSCTIM